jgi:excisionase family DNA binding protein
VAETRSSIADFGRVPLSGQEFDQRLTVAVAARVVGCSDDTIRRGYWSGHLRVERLGARLQGVRIPRSELERWLADGARTA